MAIDKRTETNAEMQLILKLQDIYKANTDKRIEDLQRLIDIRDQEIDLLLKENKDLRQTIKEKDERIDELTYALLGKHKAKCKVVSIRPAYAR